MAPSRAIGIIVATLCLVLGVMIFTLQSNIVTYIDDHGDELGLTPSQENALKNWYNLIGYAVFVFFVVEILRYRAAVHFSENIYRHDGEFEALLAEEDRNYQDRLEANTEARTEKYSNLRKHYKDKYSKKDDDNIDGRSSTGSRNSAL